MLDVEKRRSLTKMSLIAGEQYLPPFLRMWADVSPTFLCAVSVGEWFRSFGTQREHTTDPIDFRSPRARRGRWRMAVCLRDHAIGSLTTGVDRKLLPDSAEANVRSSVPVVHQLGVG